jgi:hypothetical protein
MDPRTPGSRHAARNSDAVRDELVDAAKVVEEVLEVDD